MDRSMGRIQFGPSSLAYLGVTALITIAAFYTQANLLFWALGLVVGALVMSLAVSVISLRGIRVHRLTPPRSVADEPLVLRYHVTNESRLGCFGVELVETWRSYRKGLGRAGPAGESGPPRLTGRPHGWLLHVGAGQTIQAEAICWPRRRGLLHFERIIVRSSFPFGVIRKCVEFQQTSSVLVHPPQRRVSRHAALSLASQDIGHARHADRGGGQDEFFGLRPYRPGDGFKLIDWKHSARTATLVSREMAKARPPRMMILLDLSPTTSRAQTPPPVGNDPAWTEAREEAINMAGALIREAYLHEIHVGLAVRGAEGALLPMQHSQAHRQRLLDALSRIDLLETSTSTTATPVRPTVVVRPITPGQSIPSDQAKALVLGISGKHRRSMDAVASHPPNTRRGRQVTAMK